MQRYFAHNKIDNMLILYDQDIHHIMHVMRMRNHDQIEVIYEQTMYICEILTNNNSIELIIVDQADLEINLKQVTIVQSLVAEKKMDLILQKLTELGVSMIVPLQAKNSMVKFDTIKMQNKKERWQMICKEASEQSKRSTMPVIGNLMKINDLKNIEYDLKILCSVNEKATTIKKVLQNTSKCDKIIVVIGPEGGFDSEEEINLQDYGFIKTSLGSGVLRTETAPIYVMSVINYEFMR